MGGRGASFGTGKSSVNNFDETYRPRAYGQITKYEAGIIYRAVKQGNLKVRDSNTTKTLYNATNEYIRYASERYSRHHKHYDDIYKTVAYIRADNFKQAQKTLRSFEKGIKPEK